MVDLLLGTPSGAVQTRSKTKRDGSPWGIGCFDRQKLDNRVRVQPGDFYNTTTTQRNQCSTEPSRYQLILLGPRGDGDDGDIEAAANVMLQVVSRSTRSLGATCPPSPTRLLPSTACASLRPMRSLLSPASGTSFAVSARSRRPPARSSPATWYVAASNRHGYLWEQQTNEPVIRSPRSTP